MVFRESRFKMHRKRRRKKADQNKTDEKEKYWRFSPLILLAGALPCMWLCVCVFIVRMRISYIFIFVCINCSARVFMSVCVNMVQLNGICEEPDASAFVEIPLNFMLFDFTFVVIMDGMLLWFAVCTVFICQSFVKP